MEQYDSISTKRNVYNAQSLTYSTKNLCFYKKKSLSKKSWSISTFFNDKYRLTFAYLKNQDEFFCTNKTSTILYQSPMEESSCSELKHHLYEMFCPLE